MGRKPHRDDDSWLDTLSHNRRFPKRGAAKHSSGGGSTNGTFNVRNIYGTYAVKCPTLEAESTSLNRLVDGSTRDDRKSDASQVQMTFDIHGLVDGKDQEVEALVGSLDFGVLSGICLMTGSRKSLREVVQMEEQRESDDLESGSDEENEGGEVESDEDEEEEEEDDTNDKTASDPWSTKRPLFEKNTFRQPKFFFEWRGHDRQDNQNTTRGMHSDNMGHLEFSDHTCKDFQGTFNSERWGKNVAFQGWKISSKPTECPYDWNEFDTDL